ncbi:Protein of unknown function [Gryllus bimaculatus]|nr:Protein of unknown function [Gryllus bimaculatus]
MTRAGGRGGVPNGDSAREALERRGRSGADMAERATSPPPPPQRLLKALVLVMVLWGVGGAAATDATTAAPQPRTSVWDAYPATMISVCPHIPRRPIGFQQLNGQWFVLEKGGLSRPQNLCEMDFQVTEGQNLTLDISLRAYSDRQLENAYNSHWIMSEDNVWRDNESQMSLFVGYSTGRSLLLLCAVDSPDATQDGYSLALSREPHARPSVLDAARLPGRVAATDRSHCPEP